MVSHLAIGIGCRKQAGAVEIMTLLREVLRLAPAYHAATIFTLARKAENPALLEVAAQLGCALRFLDEDEFFQRQPEFFARGASHSTLVEAATGFASVAEAAALMGGGPKAELIVKKHASGNVTCAIAAEKHEKIWWEK